MLINDTKEYDIVWDKVYKFLKFNPDCHYIGHSMAVKLPFEIDKPYSVYAIDKMNDEHIDKMDDILRKCLANCTQITGKMWYALDWQHSAFKFNPNNIEEQKSIRVKNPKYIGGEYDAYFPSFYPDGDYYFFIDEDFENGYLSHPWREEVWIFGSDLLHETEKIYKELGWIIIK